MKSSALKWGKSTTLLTVASSALLSTLPAATNQARADRLPAEFVRKRFSINFKDTTLSDALKIIGEQGGVKFQIGEGANIKITKSFTNATLESAFDEIVSSNGLTYFQEGKIIYIEKDGPAVSESSARTSGGGSSLRAIKIERASAQAVIEKIPKNIFKTNETIVIDDSTNTVVFSGSEGSYNKLLEFVKLFDTMPIQIVIEAQILETSKNFLRDVGLKWGLGAIETDTSRPQGPNLAAKLLLGTVNGQPMDVTLQAAENNGDAKIISRPKVVTLNNQPAVIHSGVTFNIKTLTSQTNQPGGGGGSSGSVSGGLQQVNAGLQLNVHPVALGKDYVKLKINVTNSEPNQGLAVDGIPGIVDNSAQTSIVVRDGATAVMAGLIKTSISNNESRVPWFSRVPVLGWLFSSHSDKDQRNELVILITPRIINSPDDMGPKVSSRLPASNAAEPQVTEKASQKLQRR